MGNSGRAAQPLSEVARISIKDRLRGVVCSYSHSDSDLDDLQCMVVTVQLSCMVMKKMLF